MSFSCPNGDGRPFFGQARRQLGAIFHALARQKEWQIIEGHLMPDHVHMCIAIPPKHPVASVIGFLKGTSAIAIARRMEQPDSSESPNKPRNARRLGLWTCRL